MVLVKISALFQWIPFLDNVYQTAGHVFGKIAQGIGVDDFNLLLGICSNQLVLDLSKIYL